MLNNIPGYNQPDSECGKFHRTNDSIFLTNKRLKISNNCNVSTLDPDLNKPIRKWHYELSENTKYEY